MRLLVRRAKRPHDQAMPGEGMTDQGGGPEAQRDARRGVPAPTGGRHFTNHNLGAPP
jgi:hypothetical protein